MIKTFDIDLYDGHLIIIIDGLKVLVDTGCPVTIAKQSSFDFMGQVFSCHTSLGGKDINSLSQLMNYDLDVFMGMDIIEKFYILTDYKQKQVTFSDEPIPFDGTCSTPILRGHMGEVCINMTVKNTPVRVALDTGARISYIDKTLTEGETLLETKDDFNPMIGNYKTQVYTMEASIEKETFPVNFGVLPQALEMPLKMMGIEGAIGFDLFNRYKVLLDFKSNILLF